MDNVEKDLENLEGQDLAIHKILSGENVFVTGSGGVGKSWVINQVKTDRTVLCAFSGIAALNIGGITCHRAFSLPTTVVSERHYYKGMDTDYFNDQGEPLFDRIIIDEISMLRADYLDLIEARLRKQANNDKPFGGIQVVVVGDFYQLPPIVGANDKQQYFFEEGYKSRFCFSSKCWDFETIELTKVFRQEEKAQINLLNAIRKDTERSHEALKVLNNNTKRFNADDTGINLCAFNADADNVNSRWFEKVQGFPKTYPAIKSGEWRHSEIPVPEYLKLKVGARIIICANSPTMNYFNGQRGEVVYMGHNSVDVRLDDTKEVVNIQQKKWEKYTYHKGIPQVEAVYHQIPLRLGWAISIHKSQGMTLEDVIINTGRGCFDHGQLYVALSRVKDLRRMSLAHPLKPSDINIDKQVKVFYGEA